MKINSISAFNYTSKALSTKPKENYNKNNSLANVSETFLRFIFKNL